MSLTSGTTLGPYEILGPIGPGGMGEVYRARDTRLNRTIAIKVLPSGLADDRFARVLDAPTVVRGFFCSSENVTT